MNWRWLFLFLVLSISGKIFSQIPQANWSKSFGGFDEDVSYDVDVQPNGDILVSGYYSSTVNLGNGVSLTNQGGKDGFVAKFTSLGLPIWAHSLSGAGNEMISDVTTDPSGNVYLAGEYTGDAVFAGQSLSHSGDLDGVIAKLSPDGAYIFSRTFTNSGLSDVERIAISSSGLIMASGIFGGTLNVGDSTLAPGANENVFTATFSESGNLIRLKRLASGYDMAALTLISNSGSGFAITGSFLATSTFGNTTLTSKGLSDVYVAKLTDLGELVWVLGFGGTGIDLGIDLYSNASGQIIASGGFMDTAQVGQTQLVSNGQWDAYVILFSPEGQPVWAKSFGGPENERANGILQDDAGNVWCFGWFNSSLSFNGVVYPSAGFGDVFLVKFSSSGNPILAKTFGSSSIDTGSSIDLDENGNLLIVGQFYGSFTVDGQTLTSSSGSDVFLMRMAIDPTSISEFKYKRPGLVERDRFAENQVNVLEPGNLVLYQRDGRRVGDLRIPQPGTFKIPVQEGLIFFHFQAENGRVQKGRL